MVQTSTRRQKQAGPALTAQRLPLERGVKARANKVLLDESREEHQLLVESLLTHRTALEMHELVLALFTPEERREFGRRLQIVKMLKAGVSQREIARELGVGIATVSRGSHEVKRGAFQKVV